MALEEWKAVVEDTHSPAWAGACIEEIAAPVGQAGASPVVASDASPFRRPKYASDQPEPEADAVVLKGRTSMNIT
jgi:hypothetical protein